MSKIDSIIFDLDGTLWSSAKAISEAWGLVLQKHENIEKKEVTEEELYSCMGLPMYDIAAKLFPSLVAVFLLGKERNLAEILSKVVAAVVVIICNYIISKLLVFKKRKSEEKPLE